MAQAPTIAAFKAYLSAAGYSANTVRVYARAAQAWRASRKEMSAYLASSDLPEGGATVRDAALRHWATWRGLPMPAARVRRRAPTPKALRVTEDLRRYHEAVEACTFPAARAVLHLLPVAGVKLGQLCRMPRRGPEAWRESKHLADYVLFLPAETPWLFPALTDPAKPVHPNEVCDQLAALRLDPSWTADVLARVGRKHPTGSVPPAGPGSAPSPPARAVRTTWSG